MTAIFSTPVAIVLIALRLLADIFPPEQHACLIRILQECAAYTALRTF